MSTNINSIIEGTVNQPNFVGTEFAFGDAGNIAMHEKERRPGSRQVFTIRIISSPIYRLCKKYNK